jgi:RNA polymerase sigma factor (sigma-70 family)
MPTHKSDSNTTDGELLGRYLGGNDPDAFAGLVRRHAGFVYSVACRQTRDRSLAEDVTQAVFLLLVRKAASLRQHETLSGWLFTAATLESRNLLRARGREARRVERYGREHPTTARDETMPYDSRSDIDPHLNEALGSLGEAERQAVLMRYVRQDPYDRVAAVLGVSPEAARQRVHRALERMRGFLAKRGVVADAGALVAGLKLSGSSPAPAHLVANILHAATQLAAGLGASKGAMALASVKANAIAAALILGTLGIAAGTIAMMARRHRASETVYLDPAGVANPDRSANPSNVKAEDAPQGGGRGAVRPPFQWIRAVTHDDHHGTKPIAGFVAYLNRGDWLRFNKVDLGPSAGSGATFTAVVACPEPYAGSTIEVRQDSLEGPVLATLTVKPTGGYGDWRAQTVPVSAPTGGVHDLFLRFSGGGWNLDTFQFILAARPGLGPIGATSFNAAKGVQTRGGVVCEIVDGYWVRYDGLDLGPGVNAIAITYACDDAHAGGGIALRLDRVDAPPSARMRVDSTGSWGRFVTRIIPLDAIAGPHDVFLTFSGQSHGIADLSRIEFLRQTVNPWRPLAAGASTRTE